MATLHPPSSGDSKVEDPNLASPLNGQGATSGGASRPPSMPARKRPIPVKAVPSANMSVVDEEDEDKEEDDLLFSKSFLPNNLSWLTSLVVHCSLLVLLAIFLMQRTNTEKKIIKFSNSPDSPEDFDDMSLQTVDIDKPVVETSANYESSYEEPDFKPTLTEVESVSTGSMPDDSILDPFGGLSNVLPGAGSGTGGTAPGNAGEILGRVRAAGGQSGDVQVSLIWNNFNDLDLHVITPAEQHIYYGNRRSDCNGELDVDANAGGRRTETPVENIYWPTNGSPDGEYIVQLHHYANHGGSADPTAYEILVKVGDYIQTFTGTISHGDPKREIFRFNRGAIGEEDWDNILKEG